MKTSTSESKQLSLFKMGVYKLQCVYGDNYVPSQEELKEDCNLVCDTYNIQDKTQFNRYAESKICFRLSAAIQIIR